MNKKIILISIIIIVLVGAVAYFILNQQKLSPLQMITNFEECAQAGYPVGESHPRQCWTPDGRHFVEEIEKIEYYGFSTYGSCQVNNDCLVSGCNREICQSKTEESLVSICILPDKPTPPQLNYECQCVVQRCQWRK